jgi:hypothetical protein
MSFGQKTIPDQTKLDCHRKLKMAIGKTPDA